jgi:hypothetical protein
MSVRQDWPERAAEISAPYLEPVDRMRIAIAFRRYPARAASLMSASLGGRALTGEQIAQGMLAIAAQLEREGGAVS